MSAESTVCFAFFKALPGPIKRIAAVLFFYWGIAINRYGFGKHFFGERKMVRLCLWFMLENVWGYVTGFTTKVHRVLMKRVLQEVIRERCKEFMRKRLEKESGNV